MKQDFYYCLMVAGWVAFFFRITDSWPGLSSLFCVVVGATAIVCTGMLFISNRWSGKSQEPPGEAAATTLPYWGSTGVTIGGCIAFNMISDRLPQYWSEISPLIGIVAVYCASRLFPERNETEAKPESPALSESLDERPQNAQK